MGVPGPKREFVCLLCLTQRLSFALNPNKLLKNRWESFDAAQRERI